MQSQNPYKPRLVLNIGIIGHRPNRLAAGATEAIQAAITDALRLVAAKLESLSQQHAEILSDDPPEVRVLSALAEGADRIGAAAALTAGTTLHALLPFDAKEYEHDFVEGASQKEFRSLLDQATSVLTLPGDREHADHAYEAVGYELLRRSDILIAVWDGGRSAGRGGTTSIIDQAINFDVPVIHVDASGQGEPTILCRADGLLPYTEPGLEEARRMALTHLPEIIDRVLAPPENKTDMAAIEEFHGETENRYCLRCEYPLLLCATFIRRIRWGDIRKAPYRESVPAESEEMPAVVSNTMPAGSFDDWRSVYAFADNLGVFFAQTFRSGYVANFSLAAIAVALALFSIPFSYVKLDLVLHGIPFFDVKLDNVLLVIPSFDLKPLLVSIEFAVILLICWNTWAGTSRKWHQKWLDYRQLAERLRLTPITACLGPLTLPIVSRVTKDHDRSPDWVSWYAQRVAREFPIPNVKFDDASIGALKDQLRAVLKDQICYHTKNAKTLEKLDNRLHLFGVTLFVLTGVVCFSYIAGKITGHIGPHNKDMIGNLVVVFTAMAPAVGAAILAIRVQGDFENFAQRSGITADELRGIRADIESNPQTIEHLRYHAERASFAFSADLADWRHSFQGRLLMLPA